MKGSVKINQILTLIVGLFVVTSFNACSDISGMDINDNKSSSQSNIQNADKKIDYNDPAYGDARDDKGKIYVCKYVTTPTPETETSGGELTSNERIKRGNVGLVHVSANSERNNLPDFPIVNAGDSWQDKHYSSRVIDPILGADILANRKDLSDDLADALVLACAGGVDDGGGVIGGGGVD